MAIFGIGAFYGGTKDVSQDFIKKGIACLGWAEEDAPTLYNLLRYVRTGDIMYIKSQPPTVGLIIKAVGIVVSNKVVDDLKLGAGVKVKWIWTGYEELGRIKQLDDKYNVRNITLYEEFNKYVQDKVIQLLMSKLN